MGLNRRDIGAFALAAAALGASAGRAKAGPDSQTGDDSIPGASFTGGDGSYKRVLSGGITLGICPDFPWTYQDNATQAPGGLDVEIFKEITKRLGIGKVAYQMMPIDSVIPALLAKRIDVVVDNLHENPTRLKVVSFTSPAYFYGGAVAIRKGNPDNITTWESLAGKVVGAYRGSFFASIVEQRKDLKSVQLYTTSAIELSDLAAGRIQAMVDDETKILKYIAANPSAQIEISNVNIPTKAQLGYARYALRKTDVDLNSAVSRALDEMRADGTIAKLLPVAGLEASRNMFNYPL